MIQIGKFKLTPLEFGHFKLDGGAMFGVIPKVLWERHHPADEKNRINMALRCLLIEVDDRKILIDTGFGEGRTEKFRKIYDFKGSDNYLQDMLSTVNLVPEQITDVILTHLHFDHCGGSTRNKDTDPVPSFPNARYYIQKSQLNQAMSSFERDRASYFPADFEPLISRGLVDIVDGPWEFMPGISAVICDGHTPGMQLIRVQDSGLSLLYAADLIPLASQFPLPWIMSYDLNPVTTLEEKRRLLKQGLQEDWLFFFEHDAKYVAAKLMHDEKGYRMNPDGAILAE